MVGGIAILAIIGGVVASLLWKRKKDAKAASAADAPLFGPTDPPPTQNPYPPPMQENAAWGQQNQYGYGQLPPQQGGYPTQDYKMPMAGGVYANSPSQPEGPHMLSSTPAPVGHVPQEMYGGPVHAPVELPSQGYRR